MAQFVKLPAGYVNLDHLASINQQIGGAYRVRWSDGMVNVIPSDEGDTIVAAIKTHGPPTYDELKAMINKDYGHKTEPKAKTKHTKTTKQSPATTK